MMYNQFSALFLISAVSLSNGVYQSKWYGGSGGGSKTLYSGDEDAFIRRVCVRSGSKLDQIKVWFNNGETAGPYGGSGGSYDCFPSSSKFLTKDTCITSINVRSGSLIDGIQFHTKGGSTSEWYGGHGGGYNTVNYDNECLTSLNARTGRLVDALQFYFGNGRRSEIIPNPDDTVYPEPDGPDPIYDHNNNPISYYNYSQYDQYLLWTVIALMIFNMICIIHYCFNRNKTATKRYKIVPQSTESEVDEML